MENNLSEVENQRRPFSKILFTVLLVFMMSMTGIAGYYLGTKATQKPSIENVVIGDAPPLITTESTPSPQIEIPPSQRGEITSESGTRYQTMSLSSTSDIAWLKQGYATKSPNPDVEVFVFADITEGSFSARVLSENIEYLRGQQKEKARVWYLHTVLAYRDMLGERSYMGILHCLSEQDKVWENMTDVALYVQAYGKNELTYKVDDLDGFWRCLKEKETKPEEFDAQILDGQERMKHFGIVGVPTIVFFSPAKSLAIVMEGALPIDHFKTATEDIFKTLR